MKMQLIAPHIHLAHGELLRLDGARGMCLTCRRGALLVSMPGCADDMELHAGEQLALASAGCILVESWGDAELSLTAADGAPSTGSRQARPAPRWFAAFGRLLRRLAAPAAAAVAPGAQVPHLLGER